MERSTMVGLLGAVLRREWGAAGLSLELMEASGE